MADPMDGCKAASDLAMIQTSLLFIMYILVLLFKLDNMSMNTGRGKGSYQNRVTSSLTSILWSGNIHVATTVTVKWSYY